MGGKSGWEEAVGEEVVKVLWEKCGRGQGKGVGEGLERGWVRRWIYD